jgi:tRNA (guanine-N7-)-methyltransferase
VTKHKLQRFEDLKKFERVFQYPHAQLHEAPPLKGNWNKNVFQRDKPIVIEIGCGRGEYTVGLSYSYPEKNYIGIDIKGARLWRGAKTGHEENLKHVAFLRTSAECIDHFFDTGELAEIWITFPDPQPTLQREKRRLTHPMMLDIYQNLLQPCGLLHLKTDNSQFFSYSLEMLNNYNGQLISYSENVYSDCPPAFDLTIQTTYEKKFLKTGSRICYLTYRFNPSNF